MEDPSSSQSFISCRDMARNTDSANCKESCRTERLPPEQYFTQAGYCRDSQSTLTSILASNPILSIHSLSEIYMNKDQTSGSIKQVKGQIKETTGKVLGDKDLESKGKSEKALGRVQESYGNLKQDIKDSLKTKD